MFCVGGCGPVGPVGPGAGRELRWGRWEAVWPTGCVMEELLEDMSIATGFTIEFDRGCGKGRGRESWMGRWTRKWNLIGRRAQGDQKLKRGR